MRAISKGGISPPCGEHCPKRHVGCQGKCDKYLEYRAKIERHNEIVTECYAGDPSGGSFERRMKKTWENKKYRKR